MVIHPYLYNQLQKPYLPSRSSSNGTSSLAVVRWRMRLWDQDPLGVFVKCKHVYSLPFILPGSFHKMRNSYSRMDFGEHWMFVVVLASLGRYDLKACTMALFLAIPESPLLIVHLSQEICFFGRIWLVAGFVEKIGWWVHKVIILECLYLVVSL